MRTRWLLGLALTATTVATAAFSACAGRDPAPAMPTPAPAPSPTQATAPLDTDLGDSKDAAPAPTEAERLAQAVAEARACTDPASAILNHPDGGVIYNNAMTSQDAGRIDRMRGVLDGVAGRADAFRCCFDHWLAEHPERELRVMLRVALTAEGEVESVGIDRRRSNAEGEVLSGCLEAIARETSFPASPTGNPTVVEYPFVVAARPDTVGGAAHGPE